MKKQTVLGSLMIIGLVFSGVSFADGEHPCRTIENACSAAGFVKGGAAGKGLHKDCMKPLLEGKTVQGVTVDSSTIQACNAKKSGGHHRHSR